MAFAIEVSTDHTHSYTSDVNGHPRKSNNTIKPRRKQLMCQTTRLAQETTRRKLWIKLNVQLERAKVWRLANPQVDQETTAQSTCTTKQKISSSKRHDRRDNEPSSERDTRKSKFQSQRRKAGTTQLIHEMHKINKEAEPLKRYKLEIKLQPQEHCSNTNKRDHQPQLSKPTNKAGTRSLDLEMWKRHTGEWKRNPQWSKGVPKSRPDQSQPNRTNSGKFSNSFPIKTLSIHIRNLLFLSNKRTNKKYQNKVSYCEYVQLTSQKRRRKASLATQWSCRIIEVTKCS